MNSESFKFGDYLKKQRLDKGVELDSIAKDTRISVTVLKDLEASKLDSLPGQTYVRGFVINYLKHLKIDPNEGVELLNQAYKVSSPQDDIIEESPAVSQQSNFTLDIHNLINKKVIIGIAAVLLIIGFYKIFNHLLAGANQEQPEAEIPISTNPEPQMITSTSTTTSTTSTSTTTTLEIVKDSDFPYVKFNKIKKAYYTIDSLDASEEIPPEYRRKSDNANSLYVRASFGDCWMRYKVDGEDVKSFILREGKELYLTGNIFYLNFGSVGNIEIFYNDRVVDAPSKTGFKLMVLPKEEATNHQYPIFSDDKQGKPHFYKEYQEKMDPAPQESLE